MDVDTSSRGISRRNFLRASATAVGGLALAGCGVSTSGTTETAPATSAQTTIEAWFWDDSLQLAVDAFHQVQDQIRVNFTKLGYDDTHKKYLTSLVARTGAPDVCALEIGLVGSFAGRGGLVNLLDAPFNAGQFQNDMVAYKWAQGTSPNGELLAMPWDIGPGGLWYRADIFEEAGLDSDPAKLQERIKTWDDWFQLGVELNQKNPNTRLVSHGFAQDLFVPMVEQQGHGWFDGNKVVVVEKATAPLQRCVEARQMGVDANIDWWGAEFNAAIKKNAIAGMGVAAWMQAGLTRDQPQTVGHWRVIRAPGGDYNQGGSFLSIPQQTTKQEAAWEFVKFVCASAEGQNSIFKAAGIFPAYKPAWNDPIYDEPVEFFGGQRTYRLWTEIADRVPANSINPNDRQANDIVSNEIAKVNKLGKDPVQAMQDAEATILRRIPAEITG